MVVLSLDHHARSCRRRWRCSCSSACPLLLVVAMRLRTTVFPATWDAQQHAGEVAGVVDEAVTGVRVVKGFGQEDRELAHLADAVARPVLVAGPAGARAGPLHPDAAGHPGVHAGGRPRPRRLAGDRGPHQLRHVPRLLDLPRADGAAGADAGRAVRHRPAGPGRRRARARHPRHQPAHHREARRRRAAAGARRGPLRRRPLRLHRPTSRCSTHFDLHVAPGEVVALVGASGSGKSTVTALLPRFYDVGAGRDHHRRRSTSATSRSTRCAARSAWCSRRPSSSPTRCGANIAYGRPDATDDEIEAAAAAAGADRLHRRAARRLRHRRRRAGPHAVGRPAPAHRPGPGHPHQPPHPRARRRHLGGRRRHRGGHPRHAARR